MKTQLITLVGCIAVLFSCKKEATSWDSNWEAPLIQDTLTLNNLVEDSILTVVGGNYELAIDRTIFEMRLSDLIEFPDTTIKHNYALNISGITVSPGFSFVSNNVQEHTFDLEDAQLTKIKVKKGGVKLKVSSPIETTTIFTIQLPGVTKNGVTLSQNFSVPPGTDANLSSITDYVDLTGYDLDLRGQDLSSWNLLQSKLNVATDPNGTPVYVNNLDTMRFEFTIDDLQLEYARGYFGSITYTDTIHEYIDALSSIVSGTIDLDAASLGLTIENGVKVGAKIKLINLNNTNAAGNMVSLSHPIVGNDLTINPATGNEQNLNPSITQITVDGSNSNLEALLENHGAQNDIGFQLKLNPWGNVSGNWDEVFDAHPLRVKLTGNMPLNIGLNDVVLKDTVAFSLDQNLSKTHVAAGEIWIKARNAFPLEGTIHLQFLTESGSELVALDASDKIASSAYGVSNSNGLLVKDSYLTIACSEETMKLLQSAKKLIITSHLNTPDSNGNSAKVAIPENAFLGLKVGAKVQVKHIL